jgi:peroxiredoxin
LLAFGVELRELARPLLLSHAGRRVHQRRRLRFRRCRHDIVLDILILRIRPAGAALGLHPVDVLPAMRASDIPLGTHLPTIQLKDAVTGNAVDVAALGAGKKGVLVMFICNHCPYVVHIRKELVRVAHDALACGLAAVAINANDETSYPQDAPPAMAKLAKEEGWRFPFLFDDTQNVARAFGAACTPDLYLFDADGRLAYHGQFDDSRPSNGKPVTGRDLSAAIEAIHAGRAPVTDQVPSVGCNIKWR